MSNILPEYEGIPSPDINVKHMLDMADKFFQHYRLLNDKGKRDFAHYIEFAITIMGMKDNQQPTALNFREIKR